MKCLLEYEKEDFYKLEDDAILFISGKLRIAKIFKDMMDEADENR